MALEPTDPTVPADPEGAAEPEPSLAEHEAQFHDRATQPEPEPEPASEEDVRRPDRPRDDTGKFVRPTRHRAKSQEAGPADVPRIAELTRRLRETEAERDTLKARTSAPPPVATPKSEPEVPAKPVEPPKEPTVDQFTTYEDYVRALARWEIDNARRQDREERTKEGADAALRASWNTRVLAAIPRHPDYEAVALKAPIRWTQDSLIHQWIVESANGAELLYTLQSNPAEVDRILALPLFDQAEALALLAQRPAGQATREPAVTTGAVATPAPKVAPRPPTPVRTSVVSAPEEPPGEDASLAEHEAYYGQRRTRR